MNTWPYQRDSIRFGIYFDLVEYGNSRHLLKVGDWKLLILADELMRPCPEDVPVQMISIRQVDREGQSIDVFADAWLPLSICAKLQPCGETQIYPVVHLLTALREGRVDMSNRTTFFRADRGYGMSGNIDVICKYGFSTLFIIPEYLLTVNHFHGRYYLQIGRPDVEEGREMRRKTSISRM